MSGTRPSGGGDVFDRERPRLRGLAYRMLGSLADADDVVQDVWLRWAGADRGAIRVPEAWLTTVTTRIAIDRLREDGSRRAAYVGPWLPEPLVQDTDPEEAAELADSLTLGFLTLLDQLKPVERAVFVLADVFAVPYAEIAATVAKSESACRQIASRARHRLRVSTPAASVRAADRALVDRLIGSIAAGDVDEVVGCLAPDVVCVSDGGAIRRAAPRPVLGPVRVARFLVNLARRHSDEMSWRLATVNGDPGLVASSGDAVDLVMAFEVRAGSVTAIRIVRNPEKLAQVGFPLQIV